MKCQQQNRLRLDKYVIVALSPWAAALSYMSGQQLSFHHSDQTVRHMKRGWAATEPVGTMQE